jgi:surfeit locus 1 family protein
MSRSTLFFVGFALAISLGCARLGFWQVARLRERQARNAMILRRLDAPRVAIKSLLGDTAVRFRRATASGRYDFANELIFALRPRNGSPGVNLLTPLLLDSGGGVLLVNRGWVYSPNGMTLDPKPWREEATARVDGFVETFVPSDVAVSTPSVPRAIRRLDRDSIQARLPYPILQLMLVQQVPPRPAEVQRVPVRLDPPPLSEGSHRSYAIQWFGFCVTGIIGTVLVVARDRRRTTARTTHEPPQGG